MTDRELKLMAIGEQAKEFVLYPIRQRLARHKKNLAGWKEPEPCGCVRQVKSGERILMVAKPKCAFCHGIGKVAGFLVPTEPDREERAAVRLRLEIAIAELEDLLKEII